MKLLTPELEKRFKETGEQSNVPDPVVVAKYFNPSGIGTWYATEYDAETEIFYGYVNLVYKEWGSFSLKELESVKCPPFGLPIERDLYCGEKKISEHCPELTPKIETSLPKESNYESTLAHLKNIDKEQQEESKQDLDMNL